MQLVKRLQVCCCLTTAKLTVHLPYPPLQNVPDAPTNVDSVVTPSTATPTQVKITFTPGADNGSPIDYFKVVVVPAGTTGVTSSSSPSAQGPASGIDVTSLLTAGTPLFDVYVFAHNAIGFSAPAAKYQLAGLYCQASATTVGGRGTVWGLCCCSPAMGAQTLRVVVLADAPPAHYHITCLLAAALRPCVPAAAMQGTPVTINLRFRGGDEIKALSSTNNYNALGEIAHAVGRSVTGDPSYNAASVCPTIVTNCPSGSANPTSPVSTACQAWGRRMG